MNVRNVTLHGAKAPDWYTPVTAKLLQDITRTIVQGVNPEKIILFGSYAYGKPTIHSDIDLLVITNSLAAQQSYARVRIVSNLFPDRHFGLDLLVRTPAEVNERLKLGDEFISEILEKGSVLYERRNRSRMDSGSRRRLQKRIRPRTSAQRART